MATPNDTHASDSYTAGSCTCSSYSGLVRASDSCTTGSCVCSTCGGLFLVKLEPMEGCYYHGEIPPECEIPGMEIVGVTFMPPPYMVVPIPSSPPMRASSPRGPRSQRRATSPLARTGYGPTDTRGSTHSHGTATTTSTPPAAAHQSSSWPHVPVVHRVSMHSVASSAPHSPPRAFSPNRLSTEEHLMPAPQSPPRHRSPKPAPVVNSSKPVPVPRNTPKPIRTPSPRSFIENAGRYGAVWPRSPPGSPPVGFGCSHLPLDVAQKNEKEKRDKTAQTGGHDQVPATTNPLKRRG